VAGGLPWPARLFRDIPVAACSVAHPATVGKNSKFGGVVDLRVYEEA
jgi:hypothetical protein